MVGQRLGISRVAQPFVESEKNLVEAHRIMANISTSQNVTERINRLWFSSSYFGLLLDFSTLVRAEGCGTSIQTKGSIDLILGGCCFARRRSQQRSNQPRDGCQSRPLGEHSQWNGARQPNDPD